MTLDRGPVGENGGPAVLHVTAPPSDCKLHQAIIIKSAMTPIGSLGAYLTPWRISHGSSQLMLVIAMLKAL